MRITSIAIALTLVSISTAAEPRVDLYGDALPLGAIARLGTEQMRLTADCATVLLPDSKTIVIVSTDRVLRYWDITTGKPTGTKTVGEGTQRAERLTLSSDGKTLAILQGMTWSFWDVASNKLVANWTMPSSNGQRPVFWDGELLAILRRDDQRVLLWERKTGTHRAIQLPLRQFTADITFHAAVSPDRRWLLGPGGNGEKFSIIDLNSGKEVHHTLNAYTSTFTPDNKQAVVFDKGIIRFYDLLTGNEVRSVNAAETSYFSLAVSPDGTKIACACSDYDSVVMDAATGTVLHEFRGRPRWARWVADASALITHDGSRLRVWDTTTWKERFERPGEFDQGPVLAVSPDGRTLASAGWMPRTVLLWDANTGKLLRECPLTGGTRYVRCLSFSPDGRTVVASLIWNRHQWFEVATGREVRDLTLGPAARPIGEEIDIAHFSADGTRASTIERRSSPSLSSFDNGSLWTYWDTISRRAISRHELFPQVHQAVWFEDGAEGVFPQRDGLRRLRASDGGSVWYVPGVQPDSVIGLPNGPWIAAWKSDPRAERTLGFFESTSGVEFASLKAGNAGWFIPSPDNRHLLAADPKSLQLWDLTTGKVRIQFALPDAAGSTTPYGLVSAFAISPDGRRAITSFQNGCGLVWDLTPALKATPRVATRAELDGLWTDLASRDGPKAYAALWRLCDTPAAVAYFSERLKPVVPPDEALVARLIAQLDDTKFATREQAKRDLERLGGLAFPALRRLLEGNATAEARARATELLKRPPDALTPETLRALRAIQVLARLGTPEANQHLAKLAGGAAEHVITRQAKAANGRR